QTTAETYATENSGSYEGISQKKLNELEKTIPFVETGNCTGTIVCLKSASSTTKAYKVTTESPVTKDTFTVENNEGVITHKCTGTGGGCSSSSW
ncbi:MAG TPA: hypothetical protein VGF47_09850, partial [Solirubrobacteraceae bacterium]